MLFKEVRVMIIYPPEVWPSIPRNSFIGEASVQMYISFVLRISIHVTICGEELVGKCNSEKTFARDTALGTSCSQDLH